MRKHLIMLVLGVMLLGAVPVRADGILPRGAREFRARVWQYELPGYVGLMFRPVINMKGPATTLMSFGIDGGYKYFGLGFRYANKSSFNYLIPDIRFEYPIHLGRRLFLEPLFEFTPQFAFGNGVKSLQIVLRPGVRLRFMLSPEFGLVFEPFLLDIGVYTKSWTFSTSVSSTDLVLNYTLGISMQYRFR